MRHDRIAVERLAVKWQMTRRVDDPSVRRGYLIMFDLGHILDLHVDRMERVALHHHILAARDIKIGIGRVHPLCSVDTPVKAAEAVAGDAHPA